MPLSRSTNQRIKGPFDQKLHDSTFAPGHAEPPGNAYRTSGHLPESFAQTAAYVSSNRLPGTRYVVRFGCMATFSVQETRRLILPLEAVVEAVLHFDRDSGGTLFHGTIVDATIESTPSLSLALTMQSSKSQEMEHRRFNLAAIAAAIIHYCRQSKIPLPRGGKKTLEAVPEGLAFCIQTDTNMRTWHSTWQQPRQPAKVPTTSE